MSEEQERLARELADELRKLKVEEILIGTLVQVSQIGYRRLGLSEETASDRDLPQTKLAIETMSALTPVLEHVVPAELIRDFNQSVANLKLAYAKAASEGPEPPSAEPGAQDEAETRGDPSGP